MLNESHCLSQEMPEHKTAVHKLKTTNQHFAKVLIKYEDVNKEILQIEKEIKPASDDYLEGLKKQRLHYKDELVGIINAA